MAKGENMEEREVVAIRYYNVWFYLYIQKESDNVKVNYLLRRIDSGEQFLMKDIYRWCLMQKIDYRTKFVYRKDFSIFANIWSFYSYVRGKIDLRKYL